MGWGTKLLALVAVAGAVGSALLMTLLAQSARPVSNSRNLLDEPRHPVTDPMWERSKAQAGKPAPMFELPDSDKKPVRLADECTTGPVVLVFIKDGCPCSLEAQPFFNTLATSYAGKVAFLGVMDADRVVAGKYHDDMRVPFRVLLAGNGAIFRSFDAGQSVYTTLIAKGGKVVKQWPGYNKAMLIELNELLAIATNSTPSKLDLSMAPDKMSSGCAFDTSNK